MARLRTVAIQISAEQLLTMDGLPRADAQKLRNLIAHRSVPPFSLEVEPELITASLVDNKDLVSEDEALRLLELRYKLQRETIRAWIDALPTQRTAAPTGADRLLRYVLPRKQREALEGDLIEDFRENVTKLGEHDARRIYWRGVIGAVASYAGAAMLRLAKWPAVVTGLGWLARKLGV